MKSKMNHYLKQNTNLKISIKNQDTVSSTIQKCLNSTQSPIKVNKNHISNSQDTSTKTQIKKKIHSNKLFNIKKLEHGEKEKIIFAALVHDIGHAAFSHSIELLLKNLGINDFCHEQYSLKLINNILDQSFQENDFHIDNKELDYLLQGEIQDQAQCDYFNKKGLYSIVSDHYNGIDCDRLDYLSRDIFNSGLDVKFDNIDVVACFQYLEGFNGRKDHIGFAYSDLPKINNFFETRHNMFRDMYLCPKNLELEYFFIDLITCLNDHLKIQKMMNLDDNTPNFLQLTDT